MRRLLQKSEVLIDVDKCSIWVDHRFTRVRVNRSKEVIREKYERIAVSNKS